jgi:hypothetical protein
VSDASQGGASVSTEGSRFGHGPGVFVLFDRLFSMSGSCVSVEGNDALVVAAVVAAGVGDVGEPGTAEGAG